MQAWIVPLVMIAKTQLSGRPMTQAKAAAAGLAKLQRAHDTSKQVSAAA